MTRVLQLFIVHFASFPNLGKGLMPNHDPQVYICKDHYWPNFPNLTQLPIWALFQDPYSKLAQNTIIKKAQQGLSPISPKGGPIPKPNSQKPNRGRTLGVPF